MTTRHDETASTPPSTRAASAAPSRARLTSRRQALGLAAAVGAAGALAACGGGSTTTHSATTQSGAGNGSPAPGSTGGGGNGAGSGSGGSGTALVATASVPVGGGKILSDPNVVVTQPTKGEFKAFSSICTHMSCPVSQIQNGLIMCPCHGSEYKISDGSVVAGPAPRPLPPVKIKVSGGQVLQA